MQDHYNLIYREEENEMLPLCQRNGVAVIPWSPLARGRLTRSGETTARLVSDEFGKSLYSASEENDAQIAGNLADVAEELDASRAQSPSPAVKQTRRRRADYRPVASGTA